MTRMAAVLVALVIAQAAAIAQPRKTLDIYFIDVEGGQSTLIVTPAGESLLIDAGWADVGRDAKRIMASVHDAGISQIDYLMLTHFHADHDGGVPALAKLIPIKTFIDYGGPPTEKGGKLMELFQGYEGVRKKGAHILAKPGDTLPLKGIGVQIVSAKGKTLSEPLPGAGEVNPACTTFKKRANDFTENAKSLGFKLTFGKFRFLDLGDLVWNELGQLVCPKNMVGESDVYLVAHHGNAFSAVPAVVAAVHPRVAIINNGENKGGDPKTLKTLEKVPGLEDLWQLHKSALKGVTKQADEQFIANLDEKTAHRIKLSASEDGSFTLTNARTGATKEYAAK